MTSIRSRRRSPTQASGDLHALFEFSRIVNASLDVDFVLSTLLLTAMGKMLVSSGIVVTRKEGDIFRVAVVKGLDASLVESELSLPRARRGAVRLDATRGARTEGMKFFQNHSQTILLPIRSNRGLIGYLSLGGRQGRGTHTKNELALLRSLLNLSGSALEKAMMVEELKSAKRRVDHRYQELNTLFDLGKEFNRVLEPDQVVRLLTFSLLGQVGVNRYAICLRTEAGMKIVASKLDAPLDIAAVGDALCQIRTPMFLDAPGRHKHISELSASLLSMGIQALVPMVIQEETKGVILLGQRVRGRAF